MRISSALAFLAAFISSLIQPCVAQADQFPGRTTYPNVPFYTTEQLSREYNDVIIVDVRSTYEYETLHIRDAINIPIDAPDYAKRMNATRDTGKMKPIVVYCNGFTCLKSYKAVLKARKAEIKKIFTYDAGVFEWTKTFPERATLLGKTPVDPKQLLTKQNLKEHTLKPKDFMAKSVGDAVIVDIRNPYQRGMMEIFPIRQNNIPLSKKDKIIELLNKAQDQSPVLLVYDATGRQIRWLQYFLEANRVKNYYFMEGGIAAYFDYLKTRRKN